MVTYFIDKMKSTMLDVSLYDRIFDRLLSVLIILLIAYISKKILIFIIDYLFEASKKANDKLALSLQTNIKRTDTLHKLVRSSLVYIIYFVTLIQILSVFGVNTTGLLASAGVVSVAVGFGAQTLVRDIITGIFIILEGQFDVGDYVKISNQAAFIAEGHVLSLGLRSTRIRSEGGEVYFIPNSSINQVVNYSQTYNLAKVEFPILADSNFEELEKEVLTLLTRLNEEESYTKHFYKRSKLVINSLSRVENNILFLEVQVKAKLGMSEVLNSQLRRDFYNEFKDRIRETK